MWRWPANHSMSVYSSAPHDLRWLVGTAFQLQQHPCMWAGGAITHKSYITQRTAESAASMLGITACWRKDSRKKKLMMNNAYYITWKCYKEIQHQWYPQLRCVNKVFGERKKSLKKAKGKAAHVWLSSAALYSNVGLGRVMALCHFPSSWENGGSGKSM